MSEKDKVTMKDVAAEAGVALGTVSKVIRGLPVGEKYKKKVDAAVKKLGYEVNLYAQGLKSGKTMTIAFLIPATTPPFFAMLTNEINRALSERNYKMLLCCTDFSKELEQSFITLAEQNKVDGIIGLTYDPDLTIKNTTRFVAIDRAPDGDFPIVASDNYQGGRIAARELAKRNCKKVAFLRTGSDLNNEPNKRRLGFENECATLGLECTSKILTDGSQIEDFFSFLDSHIHNKKLDFDGIFCVTDLIAYSVINHLTAKGIRIPQDVNVIGFDGINKLDNSGYVCSTIVQPVRAIAETCVDLILSDEEPLDSRLICLPVSFAEGGTTK